MKERSKEKTGVLGRTFGLELEYADVRKDAVRLPSLYRWNDEAVIRNSDGTAGRRTAPRGGKINTPPLHPTCSTRQELRRLLDSLKECGAYPGRDLALHVHIAAGDLNADELRRVFFLCYHVSGILKQMMHLPEYVDSQELRPSPDLAYCDRVRETTDLGSLAKAFENNSSKGWKRHMVNIASCFVRGTVEFRLFNSTLDYDQLMRCVMFCYRFLQYALSRNEEEYAQITSEEELRRRLKIRGEFPRLPPALICSCPVGEAYAGGNFHKALNPTRPLAGLLARHTGEILSTVNPQLYRTEVRLAACKKIRVYVNDEYHHILWRLATGDLRLRYFDKAEFLQPYATADPLDQLCCALVLRRLVLFFGDNDQAQKELDSYVSVLEETMDSAREAAAGLYRFLRTCEYRLGTVNDALEEGGEVFFQFDSYDRRRTMTDKLRKVSNYDGAFEKKTASYRDIPQELRNAAKLCLFSKNEYLPMVKLGMERGTWFYSTSPGRSELSRISAKESPAAFKLPGDDLRIEDPSRLRILPVPQTLFARAQQAFVRKVDRTAAPNACFFVMYDGWLLGGLGFDYPSHNIRSGYDLWLLSDFCTNNRIPRLSKLILLAVKSQAVRRMVSRRYHKAKDTCYTKVYTHSPVSMKYRGAFKKETREGGALIYSAVLGSAGDTKQIIEKYQSYLKAMK